MHQSFESPGPLPFGVYGIPRNEKEFITHVRAETMALRILGLTT